MMNAHSSKYINNYAKDSKQFHKVVNQRTKYEYEYLLGRYGLSRGPDIVSLIRAIHKFGPARLLPLQNACTFLPHINH